MTLYYESETRQTFPFDPEETANHVFVYTMDYLECPYEAEVTLLVTDAPHIREINREQRKIDAVTDVLSFPMTEYKKAGDFSFLERCEDAFHPETGELLLGDIVICADRVLEQAKSYGHSQLREFAFLLVHSLLHLTGYDHIEEADASLMEHTQADILRCLQINR